MCDLLTDQVILIADGLYDDDHPALLSCAIHDHLKQDKDARVVMMVPLRDITTRKLLVTFKTNLAQNDWPLVCFEEHSVEGQDDWGEDEDAQQVECWWGVFESPSR